jgi:hypothetical protein
VKGSRLGLAARLALEGKGTFVGRTSRMTMLSGMTILD